MKYDHKSLVLQGNSPVNVMENRKNYKIKLKKMSKEEDTPLLEYTESERFSMVWQLTSDLWSFMGDKSVESRFQRHVAKLISIRG